MKEGESMKIRKEFYLSALFLALPNIIQQLVTNFSQMVDNVMVGSLQEVAIAGVTITNQIFFIFLVVLLGFGATGGIFISQYRGIKNDEKVTEVFRVILLFSLGLGVIFFLIMHFTPELVLQIFAKDPATIDSALSYIQYIKYTFLIFPISMAIAASYRYISLVKIPMYISIITVIISMSLNYVLIYGHFGFPALGVPGAAIGTLIARIVELLIFLILTRKLDTPIKITLKKMFSFELYILKNFINKGYGLITNEFMWALSIQILTVIYTQRISENIAAMSIANVMMNMVFIGMGGMSVAISIIIGDHLGQGKFEKAKEDAKKLIKLGAVLGIALGLVVLGASFFITMLYDVNPDTLRTARIIILITTFFSGVYYLNACIFFIIRAGGDTKGVLIMDSGFNWVVFLPLAFIIGKFIPVMYIHYLVVQFINLIKFATARYMYKKYNWLNNLTVQPEEK